MALAPQPSPAPPSRRASLRALTGWAALALLAVLAVLLVIRLVNSVESPVQRDRVVQEISIIQPPPPPPVPPEPEEKIMEEEPEIVDPTDEPQISEEPVDQPSEEPSDAPSDAPSEAAGLDRAADAGSDSFRLAAGKGGGLFGRGGGGGGGIGWGRYVESHIERALQRDARTRAAKGTVQVSVNIDPTGRFQGAALRSSTGDMRLDAAIREVLAALPPLGRSRPAGQQGMTHATITMKRTAS